MQPPLIWLLCPQRDRRGFFKEAESSGSQMGPPKPVNLTSLEAGSLQI